MTIKEKIMRIMELALEINPPEIEGSGKNRTAVFVRWSPHCNLLRINICLGGWHPEVDSDKIFSAYTDSDSSNSLDMMIAELEQIRAELPGDKT